MSALFGVVRFDGGEASEQSLNRLGRHMTHLPVETHHWSSSGAGLAAMARAGLLVQEGYAVAFDGRLDNRSQLAATLGVQDTPERLVLAAYRAWGPECASRLEGDFALAVYCTETRRLFCARDRFGCRPFYFLHLPGKAFSFASQARALLGQPDLPLEPDPLAICDFLEGEYEDIRRTAFQGVERLPPATTLLVDATGSSQNVYWRLDPERRIRLAGEAEYCEAFRELLCRAVKLRQSPRAATMLSGGLDSSSITCAAASQQKGPLRAYSAVFPSHPETDESFFIEACTRRWKLSSCRLPLETEDLAADLLFDAPLIAPNLFINCAIYRQAREDGVEVLLDGFDGDNVVSHGVAYLRELALQGSWLQLAREATGYGRFTGKGALATLWRYWLAYHPSLAARVLRRVQAKLRRPPPASLSLMEPGLRRELGIDERRRQLRRSTGRTQAEHHHALLNWPVLVMTVELLNQSAAAYGLGVAFPFFDRELVEFSLAAPAHLKLNRGRSRYILRRSMEGILPPEVQWRSSKSDFTSSFLSRMRGRAVKGELPRAEELDPNLWHYVSKTVAGQLLEECRQPQRYSLHGFSERAFLAWKVLELESWLRNGTVAGLPRPEGV